MPATTDHAHGAFSRGNENFVAPADRCREASVGDSSQELIPADLASMGSQFSAAGELRNGRDCHLGGRTMKISRKLMTVLAGTALLLLFVGGACNKKGDAGPAGATGPVGPPAAPPPTNTSLTVYDTLPGMVITVNSVTGGSGTGGAFQVGDKPRVNFIIKKTDGTVLPLTEVNYLRVMFGGPTFNYQRVIGALSDILTTSVQNSDGTYTYTFSTAIPATYLAPYNDTASYDTTDGELTGQALLSGTYTVAIYGYKNYTIDGNSYRDLANTVTKDVLFGTAATISSREVVKTSNCNQCHVRIEAHGGSRNNNVTACLMCHTSGAEDTNASGATPGVLIDFRTMIHKIHNGAHLPSVNGRGVTAAGVLDYTVTPKPYMVTLSHDYSEVNFPVWPNLNIAMPRNNGYTALTAAAQTIDNNIRMGVTNCNVCHGDPDGTGSLTAPAQGNLSSTQPTRRACGSCHDDIDWTKPYQKNGMTMPAQANDSACMTCHIATGTPTAGNPPATVPAHVHPVIDPVVNPGLNFAVSNLTEAGVNNGNGKVDPGEKISVTFSPLANDGSTAVLPASITSITVIVNGPTDNRQILLYTAYPVAALTGSAPFITNLPEPVLYERVGIAANDAGIETFTTARTPHWNVTGGVTTVFCRSATGAVTAGTAAAPKDQNWIDVASTAGIVATNYIVIDDGLANEEYRRVALVDGNRLWFAANGYTQQGGLTKSHANGASVKQVTLTTKTVTTDYTLAAATGVITEAAVGSFPAGQTVVVSYTSDFIMPSTYSVALNNSPDLGEEVGEWTAKPIVDGTYTFDIFGYVNRVVTSPDTLESVTYRGASPPALTNFLVGATATTLEPYTNMNAANCNRCHQELYFHGGSRRGYDTCAQCHQTSGAEDRPKYATAISLPTPSGSVEFRNMLHKIHRGKELYFASSYAVIGNGGSVHMYDEVGFPAMRDGVKNCGVCHGNNANFHDLTKREHPTAQGVPVKHYTFACLSCHDGPGPAAHASLMTTAGGGESCSTCHGDGKQYSVEVLHRPRP